MRWRPLWRTTRRLQITSVDPTTLGIRGADSSKFAINAEGELTFKAAPGFAAPNFEKPADADKDNVYEVTITAADGNANMATRDVKVTVTNAEEAGTVKLSQPRPRVGVAITASYSDPDGGLASAEWQWWRTQMDNLGTQTAPRSPYRSRAPRRRQLGNDCRCDFGHLQAGS